MSKIPKQPASSHWTKQQWQAIHQGGSDLLVAAAAGSGKTAVLVERIVQRIIDEKKALDVDRLLVVTFTNAAAAEMRKRIGDRLEEALNANPHSLHLQRQRSLLYRASISTIHAFCMRLIQRFYHLLELDPEFRIADEGETILLQEEVLEQVLEAGYTEGEDFYELADHFSRDRDDQPLFDVILQLYTFARSYPWPAYWLEKQAAAYTEATEANWDQLPWIQEIRQEVSMQLDACSSMLTEAIQIAQLPGGPTPYLEQFSAEQKMVSRLQQAGQHSWHQLYTSFQAMEFQRLNRVTKKDAVDEDLKQQASQLRKRVKEQLEKLRDNYFVQPPSQLIQDLHAMAPVLQQLVQVVKRFSQQYQEAKRARGIVDFHDLEHYALQLLQAADSTPVHPRPSAIAMQLQGQYEEIYVDEYQDTNLVQEMILQLIARGTEAGSGGNRFMVGDVKQSIYRFRLADPTLFLQKYKRFTPLRASGNVQNSSQTSGVGIRIDLNQNFRSRPEVLDATNFLFQQLMDEVVGELNYDEEAALYHNQLYPPAAGNEVEVHLLDRDPNAMPLRPPSDEVEGDSMERASKAISDERAEEQSELDKVQLEARWIAMEIRRLMGQDDGEGMSVYEPKKGQRRRLRYRDIVILLRSAANWAPIFMEELKQAGIPVYAELGSGYFAATEVQVMLSLLQVIDNPYQDIPLASLLRSPLMGCNADELTLIRLQLPAAPFYDALRAYAEAEPNTPLGEHCNRFLHQLEGWRTYARRHSVADLIALLYRETHYDDFVAGLPGGKQRQANLRALYDRARQYEETSYRGLFRFMRFIQRLQDQGGDMGTARSLGEQEDVVRVMTIHKSKGLEFPVVFVAGLNKHFNLRDLSDSLILHQELGMGMAYVNPILRLTYPTIAKQAIQQRLKLEMLAEEMRVLYVALTRAQEKLFLVASVNDLAKSIQTWREVATSSSLLLPAYERSKARSYLDWLGPALLRHRDTEWLQGESGVPTQLPFLWEHPSRWHFRHITLEQVPPLVSEREPEEKGILQALIQRKPVPRSTITRPELFKHLQWHYPYPDAEQYRAKQAVTELKRLAEACDPYSDRQWLHKRSQLHLQQPRFLQGEGWLPTEKGTWMHLFMQHVPLKPDYSLAELEAVASQLVARQFLTAEAAQALDLPAILRFFQSELGQRLVAAKGVYRELPFSYRLSAKATYPHWQEREDEAVLIQGVIDVLFQEEDGWVLLDYKTDRVRSAGDAPPFYHEQLRERYRLQLTLYQQAVEEIGQLPLKGSYLYFFQGGLLVEL